MSLFCVEIRHKSHQDFTPYVPDGSTEPVIYSSVQEANEAASAAHAEQENPAEYETRVSLVRPPESVGTTFSRSTKPWSLRKRAVAFVRAYGFLWWVTFKWFFRVKVFRRK